ncbi:hypothetical protein [Flavobacterium sp.]|uniref:hypothetical protein n=1 Tax=Flavobacterium sp. TaxID=239 RepID=UPI003752B305
MKLNKVEQIIGTIISVFAILLFFGFFSFESLGLENKKEIYIFLGVSLTLTFSFCFFIFYKLQKSNKLSEIDYLNIGIQRYILGIFMIFYGVPKLFGTFFDYQLSALDTKLVDVSEFELAWYYFGKNNWQELVAGILEFVPGILLFNRRTYYFASLILLFVTSQVFILNLFFNIGNITFPAATILLACNIYIIFSQKQNIINFFKSLNFTTKINFSNKASFVINMFKVFGLILVFGIMFIKAKQNLIKSDDEKKYQLLVGKYTLEKVIKNNKLYIPLKDSTLYKDLYIEKQNRFNILRDFNNNSIGFILKTNISNDSINLYINRGGSGDDIDIIDSKTVLKGKYKLTNNQLKINGIQVNDTLELLYKKQDLKPKKWFW